MKTVKFEVTQPELLLLITLISDQLFRREFIDPKMPGYKGDPAELAMGKELVLRFKSVIRQASESPNQSMSNRHPGHVAGFWTLTRKLFSLPCRTRPRGQIGWLIEGKGKRPQAFRMGDEIVFALT
jgi:hypothetical protein